MLGAKFLRYRVALRAQLGWALMRRGFTKYWSLSLVWSCVNIHTLNLAWEFIVMYELLTVAVPLVCITSIITLAEINHRLQVCYQIIDALK